MIGCRNCVVLRAQLNDKNIELGQRMADGDIAMIRHRWAITGSMARVLLILFRAKGRPVRSNLLISSVIHNAGDGANTLKQYISKIRGVLGHDTIETIHAVGYRLTSEGMALLETALVPDPGPPPPEVDRFMGANDEPTAMGLAVAMTIGRLAHLKGVDYARDVFANTMAALDKQYGPAS